jgi:hypothetical protein
VEDHAMDGVVEVEEQQTKSGAASNERPRRIGIIIIGFGLKTARLLCASSSCEGSTVNENFGTSQTSTKTCK